MTDTPTAKERAQEAAGTAGEESRHLAGVAQQEASNVASEAATQARQVYDEALTQVNAQSREQKDRLAGTLRTFGDDLDSMATQANPGLATDVTRQVSGYVRSFGTHLQTREPGELLDDVRRFARRRPGTFLLGALAAGVVVGRIGRGAADGIAAAQAQQGAGTGTRTGTGTTTVPTTPATVAGTGETPAYPGAPSGAPYVPDPSETPASHGQPTGVPVAPSTTAEPGSGQELR